MAKFIRQTPRVAILLAAPHVTHMQMLRGILRYTQHHTPWTLDVRTGRDGEPNGFDEATWRYDGIIVGRTQPNLERLARRHRTPTVLLNDLGPTLEPVARIRADNASLARMAAEFLAKRGFTHFAYVGAKGELDWSQERGAAFAAEAAALGFGCRVFPAGAGLGKWLLTLPRPTAVFASSDIRAREVLDACAEAGISVPDGIAILGVDNDNILCETSSPTISSIAMTTEEAGYRAAEALDAAMASGSAGRRGETETITYAAKEVVERRSTVRDTTRDELARRCRALIEANVARHFGVADLAKSLFVSRRTLETRFRAATGRTVGEEIAEQRVRRAKTLLSQSRMTQAQIAKACGFTDASHMNVVFRRCLGSAPGAFRD